MKTNLRTSRAVQHILRLVAAGVTVDRVMLHFLYPSIPYGTFSGRIADLVNRMALRELKVCRRHNVGVLRMDSRLSVDWNPAASSVAIHMYGTSRPKRYGKGPAFDAVFDEVCCGVGPYPA